MILKLPVPYFGFDLKSFFEGYGLTVLRTIKPVNNEGHAFVEFQGTMAQVDSILLMNGATTATVFNDYYNTLKAFTWDYQGSL